MRSSADRSRYPFIVAWGIALASFDYYINAEVDRAINQKAPATAIYRDAKGKWITVDQIENPNLRTRVLETGFEIARRAQEA